MSTCTLALDITYTTTIISFVDLHDLIASEHLNYSSIPMQTSQSSTQFGFASSENICSFFEHRSVIFWWDSFFHVFADKIDVVQKHVFVLAGKRD